MRLSYFQAVFFLFFAIFSVEIIANRVFFRLIGTFSEIPFRKFRIFKKSPPALRSPLRNRNASRFPSPASRSPFTAPQKECRPQPECTQQPKRLPLSVLHSPQSNDDIKALSGRNLYSRPKMRKTRRLFENCGAPFFSFLSSSRIRPFSRLFFLPFRINRDENEHRDTQDEADHPRQIYLVEKSDESSADELHQTVKKSEKHRQQRTDYERRFVRKNKSENTRNRRNGVNAYKHRACKPIGIVELHSEAPNYKRNRQFRNTDNRCRDFIRFSHIFLRFGQTGYS